MLTPKEHGNDAHHAQMNSSLKSVLILTGRLAEWIATKLPTGKVAGAGFAGHAHIHIVPRWDGDTNFMPATGNTKVISESLEAMHKLLRDT